MVLQNRDIAINHEPVENRFIYVTIQIGSDAKQIAIQLGVGVYMNVCLRGTYCLLRSLDAIFSFHLASV